jgi:hypothetical protein
VVQLTATPRVGFRSAASVLDRFLAPMDQRRIHISSASNDALGEANATLFLPNKELTTSFEEPRRAVRQLGLLHQPVPADACGRRGRGLRHQRRDGRWRVGPVVTGTGAISKGTVFTIANVFATHPITGVRTGSCASSW